MAALGGLAAAPAVASTAPSMITTGNDTEIAVQGPSHSLHFYWAVNGVPGWNPEKIAGAGTTFAAPAMTNNGDTVDIAVEGPNNSLVLYWATDGVPGWHHKRVAGVGTTYSALAAQ